MMELLVSLNTLPLNLLGLFNINLFFKGKKVKDVGFQRVIHVVIVDKFAIIHRGQIKNNFYCVKTFSVV